MSKCHRNVWKSILSEALSIARSRQSKAVGPSFSKPCQFPPAASLTASQIAVCAGGGVYSGVSSIGSNDEQPATNRARKTRQYGHRAGAVHDLFKFILKSISLSRWNISRDKRFTTFLAFAIEYFPVATGPLLSSFKLTFYICNRGSLLHYHKLHIRGIVTDLFDFELKTLPGTKRTQEILPTTQCARCDSEIRYRSALSAFVNRETQNILAESAGGQHLP